MGIQVTNADWTEIPSVKYYIGHIIIIHTPILFFKSLVAQMVKNLPAMQGSIPGLGRFLGEENVTHSNTLAWRIPWTEEPGGLQSMGSLIFPILLILYFPVFEEKAESNFFQKFSCPKFIHFLLKSNHTCEQKVSDTSVQFSRSVVSDSLWPHGLQHARPPCPSPTPRVHSNSCPLSHWCHPAI